MKKWSGGIDSGIKTLGKRSYDLVEARGLVYKLDAFDIYSNSWGPSDDGRTMEKMGSMVAKSILKGVTQVSTTAAYSSHTYSVLYKYFIDGNIRSA